MPAMSGSDAVWNWTVNRRRNFEKRVRVSNSVCQKENVKQGETEPRRSRFLKMWRTGFISAIGTRRASSPLPTINTPSL